MSTVSKTSNRVCRIRGFLWGKGREEPLHQREFAVTLSTWEMGSFQHLFSSVDKAVLQPCLMANNQSWLVHIGCVCFPLSTPSPLMSTSERTAIPALPFLRLHRKSKQC